MLSIGQVKYNISGITGSRNKVIVHQFAIYRVLGLTYVGLALGEISDLRMNRAIIALLEFAFGIVASR